MAHYSPTPELQDLVQHVSSDFPYNEQSFQV